MSFSVYFLHNELSLELDNPNVMASLRYSAADESEDTLNSFTSHTQTVQFPQAQYWSDDRWKAFLAAGGGAKRRYQYCTDISGTILYFRALQGHSRRSLIDPSLQDNVVIQSGFFQHIYHIGCAFNLHSIINNGLIPGGQNSSKETDSILLACATPPTRRVRTP